MVNLKSINGFSNDNNETFNELMGYSKNLVEYSKRPTCMCKKHRRILKKTNVYGQKTSSNTQKDQYDFSKNTIGLQISSLLR